jgi:hypothetical protein
MTLLRKEDVSNPMNLKMVYIKICADNWSDYEVKIAELKNVLK